METSSWQQEQLSSLPSGRGCAEGLGRLACSQRTAEPMEGVGSESACSTEGRPGRFAHRFVLCTDRALKTAPGILIPGPDHSRGSHSYLKSLSPSSNPGLPSHQSPIRSCLPPDAFSVSREGEKVP